MAGRRSEGTSDWCQVGEHERCPHKLGGGVYLFRRSNNAVDILCACNCHNDCPVTGRGEAPDGEWLSKCTCPGSDQVRDIEMRVKHRIDARRVEQAEVFCGIDIGVRKSADEIQRQILSAYHGYGYEPPSDYSRWSRFLSAGTGRRGTRTLRLLAETARGLDAARKKTAATSDEALEADSRMLLPDGDDVSADMAVELRSVRRAFAAYAALSVAAVAGAYFTSGIARIVLMIVAVLLAAIATWVGLWTRAMGLLASVTRSRPGRRRG